MAGRKDETENKSRVVYSVYQSMNPMRLAAVLASYQSIPFHIQSPGSMFRKMLKSSVAYSNNVFMKLVSVSKVAPGLTGATTGESRSWVQQVLDRDLWSLWRRQFSVRTVLSTNDFTDSWSIGISLLAGKTTILRG